MYYVMVLGLMVVLPLVSSGVELGVTGGDPVVIVGRWFLFWGAGVRLFIAGISQVANPAFTTENILGEKNPGASHIVQELGFANLGFGVIGLAGAWVSGWAVPAAIGPGVFLLVAGIRHIAKRGKNGKEWLACITDLLVGTVLVVFVVVSFVRGA